MLENEKSSGGNKNDQDKPRMDLLPPRPLIEIAEVLTQGAAEYGEYNWAKGLKFSRLKAAMDRHMAAWWAGEDLDPKSGKSHLAHVGCSLLFMMDLQRRMPAMDDRPDGMVASAFDLPPLVRKVGDEAVEDLIEFQDDDFVHFVRVVGKKARELDVPAGKGKAYSWSLLLEAIRQIQKATGLRQDSLLTMDDIKVAVEKIRRLDEKPREVKAETKSSVSPPRKRGRPRKVPMFKESWK